MRNDVAGLRTWLLAAFGGWALLVWAATLFGLGSRIGTADGIAELPMLPALPAAGTPRPQATDNTQALERPLFASDRRPHPFVMGEAGATSSGSVRLTGVLMTPGLDMATLTTEQGQSLRLRLGGEPQSGWQLLSLQPRGAVVSGPSGTLNLELEVFSGRNPQGVALPPPADIPASSVPTPVPPVATNPAQAQPANGPSAEQIQAIRERIQARRRQAQQQRNGSSPAGQNP
ncbi:general secretion pathway protein GspN [Stenotrophomonas sp. SY1]|uniref:general secretion pathway protein GspN n=1 Tax=Stenotrophomonas sp. SY1 TaxID=477235 RepID=UPI001E2D2478|nr:general secretion pathway protein GspN [Stenotrophomonas sp. SY1]MCD9085936.1 general secretion pathway protein GspN [Stenotrophomonas sp. SY1]